MAVLIQALHRKAYIPLKEILNVDGSHECPDDKHERDDQEDHEVEDPALRCSFHTAVVHVAQLDAVTPSGVPDDLPHERRSERSETDRVRIPSGGPNVPSLQNGSREARNGEHQVR